MHVAAVDTDDLQVDLPPGNGKGIHLFQVTDRKAGKASVFEKCIDDVREAYADEQRPALAAKLRKDATIKITLP